MSRILFGSFLLVLIIVTACDNSPEAKPQQSLSGTETNVYEVKGIIVSVDSANREVTIKHEEVPGYMKAMTMPFSVKDTNELAGLNGGESVSFRMYVTAKDGWIADLRRIPGVLSQGVPETGEFRHVREVEELQVGDRLPEYTFTNEFAQIITTSQFKGQALAI